MSATSNELLRVLREQFGYESFRPGQEEIIRTLLDARDVLALLPTGAGKSLVYQLTAQLLPGLTIVVSPLLALMQDQGEHLQQLGIGVAVINSAQTATQAQQALEDAQHGNVKLLYVTPERFGNKRFMRAMKHLPVSMVVVDEAHCIGDWGHSFRPAYLLLPQAIAQIAPAKERPTVLALTATANPWVRQEIVERLELRDPQVLARGFDRPNLFLEVRSVEQEYDDRRVLHELLVERTQRYPDPLHEQLRQAMTGSGIIYTATTAAAKETANWLREWGIAADYYHGQRKKGDRVRVQDAFMNNEIRVVVATNAFGLGVDKPDVRFVIHRDVPASLEAYYQEAGRAGRDGEFARCTIIYRSADLGRAAFLAGGGQLTHDDIEKGRQGLLMKPNATRKELADVSGLSTGDVVRFVDLLKSNKMISERRGRIKLLKEDFDPATISLASEERRLAYEKSRLEMMRGYVENADCRRRYLLNYFGKDLDREQCDACDNDIVPQHEERVVIEEVEAVESPFALGDCVHHATLGKGTVQRIAADSITVLFEGKGYKTLALALVLDNGLLQAAHAAEQSAA
jgi:ATP-dependent DNA helicase RecQ